MSPVEFVVVLLAGMAAGGINAMVGSGTLITFPTLLFLGYPPLVANVSNNIGLVAGGFGGVRGYRDELAGHTHTIKRLMPASAAGAITGALLLLILPASAFDAIVPALIAVALLLVLTGPRLQAWAAEHHPDQAGAGRMRLTLAGVFLAGIYGGYFGAAQGVLLIGVMSVLIAEPLQRINAFKNVLGTTVNGVAAAVFLLVAWDKIDWAVVVAIAIGALFGGYGGARLGRRLPPAVLRGVIVVVGTVAIVKLVAFP
ncbi:MAG: sulfite exporter TauE/SafE family protein [Solirubrobacteraceae bacterium]|nr:sulfite exporter TauE/SafE family protein [Solirubrobacteraceae bacterium]